MSKVIKFIMKANTFRPKDLAPAADRKTYMQL